MIGQPRADAVEFRFSASNTFMPHVLPLPGAINFRDFGGYVGRDGARLREGVLFRSGMMAELTEHGREAFVQLDIGTICDLRRDAEKEKEPTPFPEHDPRRVYVPIDPQSGVRLREALEREPLDLARRVQFMIEINRELALDHVADYRRVFAAVLDSRQRGFLLHCSAGKDRTGFGVALIQLALGVERDAVFEDYLLTNTAIDFERFIVPRLRASYPDRQIDVEQARALSGVRAEYLAAALDAVDERFGSVERYLTDALGLDAQKQAQLERALLV